MNNQQTPENHPAIDKIALKDMIGNNKIKEVLDILVKMFPKRNDLMLQKSRFSSMENKERLGIISSDAYNMERNKIVFSVLEVIDEL